MPLEYFRLRCVRIVSALLSWALPYSIFLAAGYYGFSLEHFGPVELGALSPSGKRVIAEDIESGENLVVDIGLGRFTHRFKKQGNWEWWSEDEIFTLRPKSGRTNELHRCRLGADGGMLSRVQSTRATQTLSTSRGPLFAHRVRRKDGSYICLMDRFDRELARVPIGISEGYDLYPAEGESSVSFLHVYPDPEGESRSEANAYVVTDGAHAVLMSLDLNPFGMNVIARDQPNCKCYPFSANYLLRITPNGRDIVRASNLDSARSLPRDAFVIEMGDKLVCATSDCISVLGPNMLHRNDFDVKVVYSVCPLAADTLLIAHPDTSITRFDLRTGELEQVLTRRPFYGLLVGIAVFGMVALSGARLIRGRFVSAPNVPRSAVSEHFSLDLLRGHNNSSSRHERCAVLFDCALLALAACAACLVWQWAAPNGVSRYYLRQVCSVLAFLLLAWAIIVGCERRTVLGRLGAITSAVSLVVYLAHKLEGDSHFAPLLTMIGVLTLSLGGTVLGCHYVQYRARIRTRSNLSKAEQNRKTFSLGKAMIAMAIVTPLFAVWGNVFPYIQWKVDQSVSGYVLYAASMFVSSYIIGWCWKGSPWGVVAWVIIALLQLGLYEALIVTDALTPFQYSWSGYRVSYFANAMSEWSLELPVLELFFTNSLRPVMLGAGIFFVGARTGTS